MDDIFLTLVKAELSRIVRDELLDEIIKDLEADKGLRTEQPPSQYPAGKKGLPIGGPPDGDIAIWPRIGGTIPAEC